jgi:hypothetical protein
MGAPPPQPPQPPPVPPQPPPVPPQQPPYQQQPYQQQPGYQQPPYQPPQRSGMPAWAIVLIVLGALSVLGLGGCAVVAVLAGKTAEKAGNELTKGLQNVDSITDDEASGIELGTTRQDVIGRLGAPARITGSCVSYHVRGGSLGDEWQFCFSGPGFADRLTSKRKT